MVERKNNQLFTDTCIMTETRFREQAKLTCCDLGPRYLGTVKKRLSTFKFQHISLVVYITEKLHFPRAFIKTLSLSTLFVSKSTISTLVFDIFFSGPASKYGTNISQELS